MLKTLLRPIHAFVEGIGTILAWLGVIDADRAMRVSNLAWPRIVTGLARMSQSAADVAMVGAALGATAIAGVGYAIPYAGLGFMLGGGIAGGTISLVSQRYSAGRDSEIGTAVKVSAVLAVLITAPLSVLFLLIPGPLIDVIGVGDQAIRYGADYLRVAGLGMPFVAVSLVGSRALVAANDAWTPMVIRSGAAVANLGFNALFIFVLDLGVVGAALGTVLSNVGAAGFFAWGLGRGRLPFGRDLPIRILRSTPYWDADTARKLIKISTPLALTNIGQSGGQFPLLAVVSLFGPRVVAAYVVALRLRDLMNTPGWGFGLASSSLVGQSLGVDDEDEAGAYARDTLRFAVTVYGVSALIIFVLAGPVSRIFVSDPGMVDLTSTLIRVACVGVVLWGVMNGSLGPLRAGGDTRWPLYGQMLGLGAFAIPAAYVGATTSIGLPGLYLSILFETGVPALVTYARFRSDKWKLVSRAYRPEGGTRRVPSATRGPNKPG